MSDYRLKVSVQNARILEAIKESGFESVAELCRLWQINPVMVSAFINFRKSPVHRYGESNQGELTEQAKALCLALDRLPEDLWTEEQLGMTLYKNTAYIDLPEDELQAALTAMDVRKALSVLRHTGKVTAREQLVQDLRDDKTLDEVAAGLQVTRERIRQIEIKGRRKMRDAVYKLGNEDIRDLVRADG